MNNSQKGIPLEGKFPMSKYSRVKILLDAILLLLASCSGYFFKKGNLTFEEIYIKFIPLYLGCWLISSLLTGKFKNNDEVDSFLERLKPFFASTLFFLGMLSVFIYGFRLEVSRFIVFGSLGIFLVLEILFLSGNYLPLFMPRGKTQRNTFSITFFFLEFLLITIGFLATHFLKIGSLEIRDSYEEVLLLIYFLWFLNGLLIHRFYIPRERNYFRMIYPFIKSNFVTLSMASIIVFGFKTGFSRLLVFGSLMVYMVFELLLITIKFLDNYRKNIDVPEISLFEAPEVVQQAGGIIEKIMEKERVDVEKTAIENKDFSSPLVREKLKNIYLNPLPEVFRFVDEKVQLDSIDILKAEVIDTGNLYNVEVLPEESMEFFMNLNRINNFRRLNKYLVEVNKKMVDGGIFVGKFEPCEKRNYYFKKRYPHALAQILYFFDFIWHRVIPKLPLLKKFYFGITRGKSRLFSMAEALGRLYFCGFEVISLEHMDQFVYFIVRKVKYPQRDVVPSYGLLFKQKRVGKGREIVYIYKMRTMHPYSEYIHQYIYDRNKLDEKGKIKDDFRITNWGKFFRKLWIDELPMIINWLKGDIKLVGVRPLSLTFFSTYPKDLQEQRTLYKPGLIPPYYVDMPSSMEEVWDSERRYLEKYKTHPRRTDLSYFFKALANILFRGAKSG